MHDKIEDYLGCLIKLFFFFGKNSDAMIGIQRELYKWKGSGDIFLYNLRFCFTYVWWNKGNS